MLDRAKKHSIRIDTPTPIPSGFFCALRQEEQDLQISMLCPDFVFSEIHDKAVGVCGCVDCGAWHVCVCVFVAWDSVCVCVCVVCVCVCVILVLWR